MLNRALMSVLTGLGIFTIYSAPANAGASDRVSFDISPKVMSKVLNRVDGETQLLVASNSAFNISTTGMIGSVKIIIERNGKINGIQFGSVAQLPGQRATENFVVSPLQTLIYQSERKTARDPGNVIEQAVLVRVTYAGATHPTLIVEPRP